MTDLLSHPAPKALVRSNLFRGQAPYLLAVLITGMLIALGSYLLPRGSELAVFLFDYSETSFFYDVYPLTIQNLMYVMVAVGLADLFVRLRSSSREAGYLRMGLLPEDDTILTVKDLGPIRRRIAELEADEDSFLPRLIDLSILQLMTSRSA